MIISGLIKREYLLLPAVFAGLVLFTPGNPVLSQTPGSKFSHLDKVLWVAGPGPESTVDVPRHVWEESAKSGAVALRFRPSREIRISTDQRLQMSLLESPLVDIEIMEADRHSGLRISIPTHDDDSGRIVNNVMISHLKPQWYHVIVTWDAETGEIDWFLNGTLQMNDRFLETWNPVRDASGAIRTGGDYGDDRKRVVIETADITVMKGLVTEGVAEMMAAAAGHTRLDGEGRTVYDSALDLSGLSLELYYEADFSVPLKVVHEDDLFQGSQRTREPGRDMDWVLEGAGAAMTENGNLKLENHDSHVVLWNTRDFPGDFLVEFTMDPRDPDNGLAILFFCARPVEGENIFSPGLPRRDGSFPAYTRLGQINSYHVSYMANFAADDHGNILPRRTTNLRKNDGFFMVASGNERIHREGEGANTVRLLKHENRIRLEVNGQIVLAFDDDEVLYGLPVWGGGKIGLRQMSRTGFALYPDFRVYSIKEKK